MKKRILASTMASVMALSAAGTSLVSFAANVDAEYKDQFTATKAELKKFVESKTISTLADNECEDYGDISGERFMKAYRYAETVIDQEFDGKTAAEIKEKEDAAATSAFLLLKQAQIMLKNYDAAELSLLVEEHRSKYNTNNELNPNAENNDDKIYGDTEWDEFADAWEEADSLTSSTDKREITNAYEALKEAAEDLKELEIKSKSDLTKAWRKYTEALRDLEFAYQPWQRGKITGSGTGAYKDRLAAWGLVYAHCYSAYDNLEAAYNKFDSMKLSKTSDSEIVYAINAMEMAAAVLRGFDADTFASGSLRKAESIVDKYHTRLVYDYNSSAAMDIYNDFVATVSGLSANVSRHVDNSWEDAATVNASTALTRYWNVEMSATHDYKALNQKTTKAAYSKIMSADLEVMHDSNTYTFYAALNKAVTMPNGKHPIVKLGGQSHYFVTDSALINTTNYEIVTIRKNRTCNLAEYIPFTTTQILTAGLKDSTAYQDAQDTVDAKQEALDGKIALLYTPANPDAEIGDPDENATGVLATIISDLEDEVTKFKTLSDEAKAKLTGGAEDKKTEYIEAIEAYGLAADNFKKEIEDLVADPSSITTEAVEALFADEDAEGADTNYKTYKTTQTGVGTAKTAFTSSDTVGDGSGTVGSVDASFDEPATTPAAKPTLTDLTSAENALADAITDRDAILDPSNVDPAVTPYETNWDTNDVLDYIGIDAAHSDIAVSNWVGKNGLCQDGTVNGTDWTALGFTFPSYATADPTADCTVTNVNMYDAFRMLDVLKADENINKGLSHTWDNAGEIDIIDNLDSLKKDDEAKPSSAAWKYVYNYLIYALQDKYEATADKTYTVGDLKKLIDDSYDLADLTIDTSMFRVAHDKLVEKRKEANAWYAEAKRKGVKDRDFETKVDSQTSTEIYKMLEPFYKQLKEDYEAFELSFQDVIDKMRAAAVTADGLNDKAKAKAITDALEQVSEKFLDIDVLRTSAGVADANYQVFDDDGNLDTYARILSNTGGRKYATSWNVGGNKFNTFNADKSSGTNKNKSHRLMMEAIEALDKAVKAATETPTTTLNYNVDGKGDAETPDVNDVSALIEIVLGIKTVDDATKATYNFDGKGDVDVNDVTKLINIVLGIESK